jgi:hypothetical protein
MAGESHQSNESSEGNVRPVQAYIAINIKSPSDLRYWSLALNVDERHILRAVTMVGPSLSAVRSFLRPSSPLRRGR